MRLLTILLVWLFLGPLLSLICRVNQDRVITGTLNCTNEYTLPLRAVLQSKEGHFMASALCSEEFLFLVPDSVNVSVAVLQIVNPSDMRTLYNQSYTIDAGYTTDVGFVTVSIANEYENDGILNYFKAVQLCKSVVSENCSVTCFVLLIALLFEVVFIIIVLCFRWNTVQKTSIAHGGDLLDHLLRDQSLVLVNEQSVLLERKTL